MARVPSPGFVSDIVEAVGGTYEQRVFDGGTSHSISIGIYKWRGTCYWGDAIEDVMWQAIDFVGYATGNREEDASVQHEAPVL